MHTDRCGNICRQKCCVKGSGKEVKIQEFMYRVITNVEPEMYDYTSKNRSHWNSNEKPKEKFGSCSRKTFDRFTTKDSYTWNITHNMESTAVWNLVQERYQAEKACDKRHPYNNNNNNNNNKRTYPKSATLWKPSLSCNCSYMLST